jgi:hypothetical protein
MLLQVEGYEERLEILAAAAGTTNQRAQAEIQAASDEVLVLRDQLAAARQQRDECAAHEEEDEVSKLQAKLEELTRPLVYRERGGAICAEVRAAAVQIAAGLDVSLCSVSPVIEVVLNMVEKLSLKQRGSKVGTAGANMDPETVVAILHEQCEVELFHLALRCYTSVDSLTGFSGAALNFDSTSTKYQYRCVLRDLLLFPSVALGTFGTRASDSTT